jgi:hypothetical protein
MGWSEGVNALAEAINTRQGEWFLQQQFTWVLVCDYTYNIDWFPSWNFRRTPFFDLCTNCREIIPMQAQQLDLQWGIVTLRGYKKKKQLLNACPHKKLQAGWLLDSRIFMRGRRCIGLVWHIPTNHLISIAENTQFWKHIIIIIRRQQ